MNKSKKAYQDAVRALGCIVCRGEGVDSPCEIHHLLRVGRRIGEDSVLGLCQIHHRGQINTAQAVSRHPWRREFESRYGTESDLHKLTELLIGKK